MFLIINRPIVLSVLKTTSPLRFGNNKVALQDLVHAFYSTDIQKALEQYDQQEIVRTIIGQYNAKGEELGLFYRNLNRTQSPLRVTTEDLEKAFESDNRKEAVAALNPIGLAVLVGMIKGDPQYAPYITRLHISPDGIRAR